MIVYVGERMNKYSLYNSFLVIFLRLCIVSISLQVPLQMTDHGPSCHVSVFILLVSICKINIYQVIVTVLCDHLMVPREQKLRVNKLIFPFIHSNMQTSTPDGRDLQGDSERHSKQLQQKLLKGLAGD